MEGLYPGFIGPLRVAADFVYVDLVHQVFGSSSRIPWRVWSIKLGLPLLTTSIDRVHVISCDAGESSSPCCGSWRNIGFSDIGGHWIVIHTILGVIVVLDLSCVGGSTAL